MDQHHRRRSTSRTRTRGDTAVTGVGTAIPARSISYDPVTGWAVRIATGAGTTASTIQVGFDALGRQVSHTDADGKATTTAYDGLDRPVTVRDAVLSMTTYGYDPVVDPRGIMTSVTDSVAGTQTARYDADGGLTTVGLPGGYTLTLGRDTTGQDTSRVYTRASDAMVVVSNTVAVNIHGQVVTDTGTSGVTSSFAYGYDKASRLVRTKQQNTDLGYSWRLGDHGVLERREVPLTWENADCRDRHGPGEEHPEGEHYKDS